MNSIVERLHPLRRNGTARGAWKTDRRWDPNAACLELEQFDERDWKALPEGTGWARIALLEPDGRGNTRTHPRLTTCPELMRIAASFESEILALTLARLLPGGEVEEHRDLSGGLSMGVIRMHLPLISDPGVVFMVDGQRVRMLPGEIWHLDTTHVHHVRHEGDRARIHLIVDLRANESLRALLPEIELGDWVHRAVFAGACVTRGAELALRSPGALIDRVARFARLRVLGQAILTFEDPPDSRVRSASSEAPPELACPECGSADLQLVDDLRLLEPPWTSAIGLRCMGCAREYPRVDGVWVMWSDALRALIVERPRSDDPEAVAKWANFMVYEQMSTAYGEHADHSNGYVEQLAALDRLVGEQQGQRVLVDVGCANGFALDRLAGRYSRTIGVDLSLSSLRQVAARGHVAVLGDAERLPLAAGTIDRVICFAALHHFPDPARFVTSAHAVLRPGGTLLTAADPSRASMRMGPLARVAWALRRPVYRALARVLPGANERSFLHADRDLQQLNELAEHHRTGGGFDPDELARTLRSAGFEAEVFFDLDRSGARKWGLPSWQMAALKGLSGQQPLLRANWAPLTSLSRKPSTMSATRSMSAGE